MSNVKPWRDLDSQNKPLRVRLVLMPRAKKRLVVNIKSDPTIERSVLALEYGDSTGEIIAARDDLAEILKRCATDSLTSSWPFGPSRANPEDEVIATSVPLPPLAANRDQPGKI